MKPWPGGLLTLGAKLDEFRSKQKKIIWRSKSGEYLPETGFPIIRFTNMRTCFRIKKNPSFTMRTYSVYNNY